jgi:hypothetical protein
LNHSPRTSAASRKSLRRSSTSQIIDASFARALQPGLYAAGSSVHQLAVRCAPRLRFEASARLRIRRAHHYTKQTPCVIKIFYYTRYLARARQGLTCGRRFYICKIENYFWVLCNNYYWLAVSSPARAVGRGRHASRGLRYNGSA